LLTSLVLTGLTSSCASPPRGPPPDRTLDRFVHAGGNAYDLERLEQAKEQYRAALDRARERDDADAIADAGFDLAASELRAGALQPAIATASEVQAELGRRGRGDPGLNLVVAMALFRKGDEGAADRVARQLTASADKGLADSGWFLRGVIADRRGDRAMLNTALTALSPETMPADRAELRARLEHSAALALQAADLRREAQDYRGMSTALALAAQFTADAGAAADLYLRAGRSAAAQGDVVRAKTWLLKSTELSADPAVRNAAAAALARLVRPRSTP
jgi:hypothetical protein